MATKVTSFSVDHEHYFESSSAMSNDLEAVAMEMHRMYLGVCRLNDLVHSLVCGWQLVYFLHCSLGVLSFICLEHCRIVPLVQERVLAHNS